MPKLRSEVVEVIGDAKDFNGEVDYKLSQLDRSELISVSAAVSETSRGTRYVAIIVYRDDDSW